MRQWLATQYPMRHGCATMAGREVPHATTHRTFPAGTGRPFVCLFVCSGCARFRPRHRVGKVVLAANGRHVRVAHHVECMTLPDVWHATVGAARCAAGIDCGSSGCGPNPSVKVEALCVIFPGLRSDLFWVTAATQDHRAARRVLEKRRREAAVREIGRSAGAEANILVKAGPSSCPNAGAWLRSRAAAAGQPEKPQ
jgi:hypothetical protein